jgi:hypothetical protein
MKTANNLILKLIEMKIIVNNLIRYGTDEIAVQ